VFSEAPEWFDNHYGNAEDVEAYMGYDGRAVPSTGTGQRTSVTTAGAYPSYSMRRWGHRSMPSSTGLGDPPGARLHPDPPRQPMMTMTCTMPLIIRSWKA